LHTERSVLPSWGGKATRSTQSKKAFPSQLAERVEPLATDEPEANTVQPTQSLLQMFCDCVLNVFGTSATTAALDVKSIINSNTGLENIALIFWKDASGYIDIHHAMRELARRNQAFASG
jgi:hypothetical protein